MKIRLTRIRTFASSNPKGPIYAALLLLTSLAFPGFINAQDKLNRSWPAPQISTVPIARAAGVQSAAKEVPGNIVSKTQPAGALTDIKIAPKDETATITVATDRLLEPREFLLDNPPRLVVDFPNTENKVKDFRIPVNAASVKQIRVAQYQTLPSPIARVVFEMEEGYGAHEIAAKESSVSVVFHKGRSKSSDLSSGPAVKPAANKAENAAPAVRPAELAVKTLPLPNKPVLKAESVAPAVRPAESAAKTLPSPNKPVLKAESVAPAALPVESAAKTPPSPPDYAIKAMAAAAPMVSALRPAVFGPQANSQTGSRFSGQPLTLDLVDTPLVDFFRLLADEGGVNIVLDPAVKGSISIKVVKMPWDQIFEAALVNNGLSKEVEGTLIRVAKKSTLQEEARQEESLKKAVWLATDLTTRVKRLNYAKATALAKILADQKTARGTVVVDERTNALILTDLPDSIDKLIQLIETLDMPQQQVEIEARIVTGTRDFARDIGIQFGFVDGNLHRVTVGGPNTSGTIGGNRPSNTPSSTYAAGDPSNGKGASSSTSSGTGAISTGTSSTNAGNYNVNLPAGRPFGGLGISIGNIFDTFLLDAAITAGESKGWAKLISQPRITAQNNSAAVVTQGLRFPVPVNANNTVTIQFFNAALTLTATPQITHEGNILLDLKVENNTPDFGNVVSGVPSIRTTESSTRVLVSDGGTTLISGIMVENESNAEDKVPGLGSLPLVGKLFSRSSVSKSTQEVLFFVTPHIVK
jgi:type IV pilus secretin PilQ/predicted competence protein